MQDALLKGIRVLDLTVYIMGPVSTMMLAAMGAEVIKVEAPGGDPSRGEFGLGQLRASDPDLALSQNGGPFSALFESANRAKKSITLDLRTPRGKALLYELVAVSDVVVQNMRPDVAAKLGFDYQTLRGINEKIVYCSGSSYGSRGPEAGRGGFDLAGAARSGSMYMTGSDDGEPVYALPTSFDQLGGMFMSYGVLAALFNRERTGVGQECETSLLASAMWLSQIGLQTRFYTGQPNPQLAPASRRAAPIPTFNTYKCADGEWIALICGMTSQWEPVCVALGIPESIYTDDRYNTAVGRTKHAAELTALLDEIFLTKTREEHIKSFTSKQIFWERVQRPFDLIEDPQVLANEYVTEFEHPITAEVYPYQNLPVQFRGTPVLTQGRAPLLGEHTTDILTNILGYSPDQLPEILEAAGHQLRSGPESDD